MLTEIWYSFLANIQRIAIYLGGIYGRTIKSCTSYVLDIIATNSHLRYDADMTKNSINKLMQCWCDSRDIVSLVYDVYMYIYIYIYKSLGKTRSSWRIEDQCEVLAFYWMMGFKRWDLRRWWDAPVTWQSSPTPLGISVSHLINALL